MWVNIPGANSLAELRGTHVAWNTGTIPEEALREHGRTCRDTGKLKTPTEHAHTRTHNSKPRTRTVSIIITGLSVQHMSCTCALISVHVDSQDVIETHLNRLSSNLTTWQAWWVKFNILQVTTNACGRRPRCVCCGYIDMEALVDAHHCASGKRALHWLTCSNDMCTVSDSIGQLQPGSCNIRQCHDRSTAQP